MEQRSLFVPLLRRAAVCALGFFSTFSLGGGAAAQSVAINEFLAVNEGNGANPLLDEDGQESDWIEIQCRESVPVSLAGWHLTDDADFPAKWRFPAVDLGPGEFLVVFASGKDRSAAGSELHTNFKLDGGGDYLALVRPDGFTVEHEFSPAYPAQKRDISYGLFQENTTTPLVAEGAAGRYLIPSDGSLGLAWTQVSFNASSWPSAQTGLGFEAPDDVPVVTEVTNIALDGTPEQSSEYNGGQFPADLAIDGNTGNFTHTGAGLNLPATWSLDLGAVFPLHSIVLRNRGDGCCQSRLRDITVSVLDDDGTTVLYESPLLNPENTLGGGGTAGPARLDLDLIGETGAPVPGRHIRVVRTPDPDLSGSGGAGNADERDVLSLGEVEVFNAVSGFEPLIRTDLEAAMSGTRASVYLVLPFTLADPAVVRFLKLRMRYDDGFLVYLNGEEVARRGAPATVAWNSSAASERPDADALVAEEINLTARRDLLRAGANVLAVHGLNKSAADSDFLLLPELTAEGFPTGELRYFKKPTPGAPNDSAGILGLVADTKFSIDRGFFESPISVEISTATPDAQIRYTLNGATPAAAVGTVYNGPIAISKTTTLRAAAFKAGLEPSNVDTHTYIFLDDVVRQTAQATIQAGFPASWTSTTPDYGMDARVIGFTGADSFGGKYNLTIKDDLQAVPTMSIVMNMSDLFGARGIYSYPESRGLAWERPASVEWIDPTGEEGWQVNAGIRIQGGAFRSHGLTKKHSLRLLFKEIYGPTKLRHAILGRGATDRFDTLVLRANSNDGWQWDAAGSKPLYIRDSFARQTSIEMGGVDSHETFAHVYLNGIYWGLYNVVERPDASFSSTYFGGKKEEWDAISNSAATDGDMSAWNTLLTKARAGVGTNAAYQAIQGNRPDGTDDPALPSYVDVENLIDYMIINLWVGNTDWPNKNWWIGRHRPAESTGFKFYQWDTEWSMGLQSDLTTDRTGVAAVVAEPYSLLRANGEFRRQFGDHVHRHFFNGGALAVNPAAPDWDPAHPQWNRPADRFMKLAERVERAVVAESARWGDQHAATSYTRDEHWAVERDRIMTTYLPGRSGVVLGQFRAAGLYPALEAPVFNQHGGHIEAGFLLRMAAAAGGIYYTTDGTDPRLVGGAVSPSAVLAGTADREVLLPAGAAARVLVPTDGSLGLAWTAVDFDDAAWTSGPTGVGFERQTGYEALIGTDIEAASYNVNASVYIRIPFDVADPSRFSALTALIKYDDGFILYLNGKRVGARNPPVAVAWNSAASDAHSDALAVNFEPVDLTADVGELRAGPNVLAIHGLNSPVNSSDFLILPQLEGSKSAGTGVALSRSTGVRARALAGGTWSALNEAVFVVSPLRITEIMYHPPPADPPGPFGADEYEFIELKNVGKDSVDLRGVRLGGAIEFDFAGGDVPSLAPGEIAVVVENRVAFASRYDVRGIAIAGEYLGQLSNSGEVIELEGSIGEAILDFAYEDFWHPDTDGAGYALVIADPLAPPASWRLASSWRLGDVEGGTPGEDEDADPNSGWQLSGDANQDTRVDLADAISYLFMLFQGGSVPLPCGGELDGPGNLGVLDLNADQVVDVSDPLYLLNYLFRGGPAPQAGERCRRVSGCASVCR